MWICPRKRGGTWRRAVDHFRFICRFGQDALSEHVSDHWYECIPTRTVYTKWWNPHGAARHDKHRKHMFNTHRPKPATQCTAMQQPGSSLNLLFRRFNQSSTIWSEGEQPSSKGQSFIREGKKRASSHSFVQQLLKSHFKNILIIIIIITIFNNNNNFTRVWERNLLKLLYSK